jgi:hypothetical protein
MSDFGGSDLQSRLVEKGSNKFEHAVRTDMKYHSLWVKCYSGFVAVGVGSFIAFLAFRFYPELRRVWFDPYELSGSELTRVPPVFGTKKMLREKASRVEVGGRTDTAGAADDEAHVADALPTLVGAARMKPFLAVFSGTSERCQRPTS